MSGVSLHTWWESFESFCVAIHHSSNTWSHVTHVNAARDLTLMKHTVPLYIFVKYITRMNDLCHRHGQESWTALIARWWLGGALTNSLMMVVEWIDAHITRGLSHMWMQHAKSHSWKHVVVSYICVSHVTHQTIHVTHMNASCHTCEYVVQHL